MGRDGYGPYEPYGRDRDERYPERSGPSGPRGARGPMSRSGDTPRRGASGAGPASGGGPNSRPPNGGGQGGFGGGGLIRSPGFGGAQGDDERPGGPRSGGMRSAGQGASGPGSAYGPGGSRRSGPGSDDPSSGRARASRPGRDEDPGGPPSGARMRRGGPDYPGDRYSSERPAPRQASGRSMADRFRDAGRSMSRQLSAMMQGAGRAGRAMRQELSSVRQSLEGPALGAMSGLPRPEVGGLPYRRSRSRMLVRKWRMRRVRTNPILYAIVFAVAMLLTVAVIGAGGAGAAYAYSYYEQNRGAIVNAWETGNNQSTTIYDRNGQLLYAIQRNTGFQFNVPYDHISDLVKSATVDTEDRTFWSNDGIDLYRTIGATIADLRAGGAADQGASTITQQLVKNLVLKNPEKTLTRKIHEAILALGTTQQYSKQEILQMYLNNIPYGDQNTGIEAAARNFFGYQQIEDANHNIVKEANEQLTLAQTAILVRLPNEPTGLLPNIFSCNSAPCPVSKWDPPDSGGGHEWVVHYGAQTVLESMLAAGDPRVPDEATVQHVLAQVDDILVHQQIYHWQGLSEGTTNSEVAIKKAPHFVDEVIKQLLNDFGLSDESQLAAAGLKVYTTLDYNLEQYLEQDASMYINGDPTKGNSFTRYWYCGPGGNAIKTACTVQGLKYTDNVHNISAVAIDPYSGDVLALMGSVDYASTDKQVLGFNDMATLPRSMGSSFKPLVYSTAFQMGWYPGIMLQDIPVCYPGDKSTDPKTGKPIVDPAAPACAGYYVAHDYDSTSFSGTASIRVMLANSLNIPATETQMFVGANYNVRQTFLDMIGRMGVSTCDACNVAGIVSGARLGPTTALGTQEIPLIQEASAYGTFPTGGRHTPTRMILRIDDSQGNTFWTAPAPQLQQVMSPQAAYFMTSILTDNYARAGDFKVENPLCFTCYPNDPNDNPVPGLPQVHFGQNQEWQYIAAKTGTAEGTTGPSGIVTTGYSPYMVLAVWAGNTDPNDDLNPNIIGITGAGYVFHDVMVWAIQHYKWPAQGFPIPPGLTRAQFNCSTGLAPYKGTDLNAFVNGQPHLIGTPVEDTAGTGWCPETFWPWGSNQCVGPKGPCSTDLYVGWNAGPWRQDQDWVEQSQFPDVS